MFLKHSRTDPNRRGVISDPLKMEHVRERVHVSQAFKDRPKQEGGNFRPTKNGTRSRTCSTRGGNFSPAKNGTRSRACSCPQAFKVFSQTPGIGMRPLSNIFPGKIEEEKKE